MFCLKSGTNSVRTAISKTSSPDSDVVTAKQNSKKSPNLEKGPGVKDVIENLWISLISFLVMIARFLNVAFEKISALIVQIYRIASFCYRKPHHAKELVFTTFRLIKADSNSTRTAIPKTVISKLESSKSEKSKSEKSKSLKSNVSTPKPKHLTGVKDVIDIIWAALMFMLMIIVRFLHSAFEILSDVFVKIYRILLFCYRKPHHAKELIVSTIHIIKVSYDAEIWTWTDMWTVLKSHLIAPMTRAPPGQSPKPKQK